MNKSNQLREEFLNLRASKGADRNNLLSEWEKFEKLLSSKGFEGEELQERVKRKMQSFYAVADRNPVEEYSAVFLGCKQTDFGARNQYITAMQELSRDKQSAIKNEFIDFEGRPIMQKGFNKGKVINLDAPAENIYIGLFKEKGKTIKGEVRAGTTKLELFSEYSFKASKNQQKSTKDHIILGLSKQYAVGSQRKLDETEVLNLLKNNYSKEMVNIKDIKDYAKSNMNDFNALCIVRGDVSRINNDPTRTKLDDITKKPIIKNSVLNLNDRSDPPNVIDCYASPSLPLNFDDMAQDVIAVGRASYKQDKDTAAITIYGAWCAEKYKLQPPKPYVEPEEQEAETPNGDSEENW